MNLADLPSAEPLLDTLTVGDAMHHGLATCAPTASLREVSELLAEHGVHCAVVADDQARDVWGIVSDIDLMRGLNSPVRMTAGNLAKVGRLTVHPQDELQRAVQLMAEHDATHVVVAADGATVGMLSTLDVARAVAARSRTA